MAVPCPDDIRVDDKIVKLAFMSLGYDGMKIKPYDVPPVDNSVKPSSSIINVEKIFR